MPEVAAFLSVQMIKLPAFPSGETAFWLLVLALGPFLVFLISSRMRSRRRSSRARYFQDRTIAAHTGAPKAVPPSHTTLAFPLSTNMQDPKQQMEAVACAEFEITPLLNREEARLLPLLESCLTQVKSGHRVMAQTSLGEIIRPKHSGLTQDQQRAAYASINSKRLDFAIFDRFGRLTIAIEYQGSGHYQAKSFMRDAVKREVLRKAGVPYVEVKKDFSHDDVAREITQLLDPPAQRDNLTAQRPS